MRTLVITMLDVEQEPNQRVHHMIRMLEHHADETVVVTKVRSHGRSLGAMLRDAFSFRVRHSRVGSVTWLAIHPPLNYAQAIAAGLVQGQLEAPPSAARRALASALSVLGIARDLALVPAFVWIVWTRTSGAFDLCVAQGPWEAAAGWLLRAFGRVRRLLYDDIDYVAGGQMLRLRHAYVAWLERELIARADVAISVGWRLAALRQRTTGRRVHVIPNGVDPQRFRGARRVAHPPTLVYVGNLSHYAGVDLAICALPRILSAIPELRLQVVGGGDPPYIEALRRLALSQGVERAVEYRGPLPYAALPDVFAAADIGLATFRPLPLREFAFPLKVLEYMAAGLVVIGTAGSETAELLARHRCGCAIPFDAVRLADTVIEILSDPLEYARASESARRAAQRFTWDAAMEAVRSTVLVGEAAPADRAALA